MPAAVVFDSNMERNMEISTIMHKGCIRCPNHPCVAMHALQQAQPPLAARGQHNALD